MMRVRGPRYQRDAPAGGQPAGAPTWRSQRGAQRRWPAHHGATSTIPSPAQCGARGRSGILTSRARAAGPVSVASSARRSNPPHRLPGSGRDQATGPSPHPCRARREQRRSGAEAPGDAPPRPSSRGRGGRASGMLSAATVRALLAVHASSGFNEMQIPASGRTLPARLLLGNHSPREPAGATAGRPARAARSPGASRNTWR